MAKEVAEEITEKPLPLIIAMKGHPGTGKSTLAHALASALKFPLIDKDDIRDSTLHLHQSSASRHQLNDLSYEAIWRVAATQLHLGLSVVIDSPLSRRTHLDRLLDLAAPVGARIVVVECRPSDEAKWRERLEGREKSWHKPSSWGALQELIKGYGGCSEHDVGDVPRLVVDTTAPNLGVEELVSRVVEFIASAWRPM